MLRFGSTTKILLSTIILCLMITSILIIKQDLLISKNSQIFGIVEIPNQYRFLFKNTGEFVHSYCTSIQHSRRLLVQNKNPELTMPELEINLSIKILLIVCVVAATICTCFLVGLFVQIQTRIWLVVNIGLFIFRVCQWINYSTGTLSYPYMQGRYLSAGCYFTDRGSFIECFVKELHGTVYSIGTECIWEIDTYGVSILIICMVNIIVGMIGIILAK